MFFVNGKYVPISGKTNLAQQFIVKAIAEGQEVICLGMEISGAMEARMLIAIKEASMERPFAHAPTAELELEIALRRGPSFLCQAADCRAYHDQAHHACPTCNRVGYLCGSFVNEKVSKGYKDWEKRTEARFRPAPDPEACGRCDGDGYLRRNQQLPDGRYQFGKEDCPDCGGTGNRSQHDSEQSQPGGSL